MKTLGKILISAILLLLLTTACGNSGKFRVDGTVDGGVTMNLRIVYHGRDNVNNVLTASRDGKFAFEGVAPEKGDMGGALVEVLDNDYRPLASFYACGGDKIHLSFAPNEPWGVRMDGNEVNERWQKWLEANAESIKMRNAAALNKAVARYVSQHPEDILSSLLMATQYDAALDPAQAMKLIGEIKPEARPSWIVDSRLLSHERLLPSLKKTHIPPITYLDAKTDSIVTFNPARNERTFLSFSGNHSGRYDSIVPALRRVHGNAEPGVRVLDIWLDSDTFEWKRTLRQDSVKWDAGWGAGSVAARGIRNLGIPTLPYFIVVDRHGNALYRGRSVTAASRALQD